MINEFDYFQPTEIKFGCGRIKEISSIVSDFGNVCLLVSDKSIESKVKEIKKILSGSGISVAHFNQIIPNPTIDSISDGADLAKSYGVDVVLGIGGGSTMDTAKAIAVEISHAGCSWDYIFSSDKQPTKKTLPVIAIPTTSGTGSHVTQVAVITNTITRVKSAIFSSYIYPKVSLIDPELTITVPGHITASTGFDVFAHAFESYINKNVSPYIEVLALEAIKLVAYNLYKVVKNGNNINSRISMAWADTLAGLSIANAGVTLPHCIGMAIGGKYPHVMHGEATAVIYPEFMRFTCQSAIKKFAKVARIFEEDLIKVDDKIAAEKSCEIVDNFLKSIGMYINLESMKISKDNLKEIVDSAIEFSNYKDNPRVATESEMQKMLITAYKR